ncbi:MAG: hypothetical protein JO215_09055 [Ktedonobacteraceae bacterium]|nr:hypothetical protein [Ktedonobacteraceae bacterium]
MLDQMQVSPTPSAPSWDNVSRMFLGHTTITVDNPAFVEAIDYGLTCYFEAGDVEQHQMTTQQILHFMVETIIEEAWNSLEEKPVPDEWRMGFTFGWICGVLNPDLKDTDDRRVYLDTLSRKHHTLYQQTSFLRHIHTMAGIVAEEAHGF